MFPIQGVTERFVMQCSCKKKKKKLEKGAEKIIKGQPPLPVSISGRWNWIPPTLLANRPAHALDTRRDGGKKRAFLRVYTTRNFRMSEDATSPFPRSPGMDVRYTSPTSADDRDHVSVKKKGRESGKRSSCLLLRECDPLD